MVKLGTKCMCVWAGALFVDPKTEPDDAVGCEELSETDTDEVECKDPPRVVKTLIVTETDPRVAAPEESTDDSVEPKAELEYFSLVEKTVQAAGHWFRDHMENVLF